MATQDEIQSFCNKIQDALLKTEARLKKIYDDSIKGLEDLPASPEVVQTVRTELGAAVLQVRAAHNVLGLAAAAQGAQISGGGDKPK